MHPPLRIPTLLLASALLTACASLPQERGYADTDALVTARLGHASNWSGHLAADTDDVPSPAEPIGVATAIAFALQHSPRVTRAYARIGAARGDLDDARRPDSLTFGYTHLGGNGIADITRSLTLGLTDLALLPARKRLAAGELERLQASVADELIGFASQVEQAWYSAVAAAQIAAMRDLAQQAGDASAELAQRFFDAGNLTPLQLALEQAAQSQARIAATRAHADALRARSTFADLLGLDARDGWSLETTVPVPGDSSFDADMLTARALEQRLDLVAARRQLALREDALGVTRRWRWLGRVEVGVERETDADGRKRGPSAAIGIPLFNQGQGATARADAALLDARADLDEQLVITRNAARLGVQRVALARDIAALYRDALVPQREAVVAHTQADVNFMLRGVFELIAAKSAEFDAYEEYIVAVRDYWLARSELRRTVGGQLPDDDATPQPTPTSPDEEPFSRATGEGAGRRKGATEAQHEHVPDTEIPRTDHTHHHDGANP